MSIELLMAMAIPWWSVAGWVSLVAEKNGFRHRRWFVASLLGGPVAWFLFYLKLRDRKERLGPGRRRSKKLEQITREKRERRGKTVR